MIGIVDTNNSPDHISYVIPGNDDSLRSINLYVKAVADAIIEARGSNPDIKEEEFVEVDEVVEVRYQDEEGGEK